MTLLAALAAEWRAVGARSSGLAAFVLYSIAADLERCPRAIGLRAVEEALS